MITIFFDLETTGLSRTTESILEVAAIAIDENFNIIDYYQNFINPGKPIPYKITEITGITNAQVKSSMSEGIVLNDFMNWVRKYSPNYVGGHNIKRFDLAWIEEKTKKYGISNKFTNVSVIDTLDYATEVFKSGAMKNYLAKTATGRVSFKLEHLIRYFGLEEQTHRAIDDVRQNIIVYKKLKELEGAADYGF